MRTKTVSWLAIIAVGGLIGAVAITLFVRTRVPSVRDRFVRTLSERLDADVELGAFGISVMPGLRVSGERLVIRPHRQADKPLISIDRFTAEGRLADLLVNYGHVSSVQLEGLRIQIPPKNKDDQPDSPDREHGGDGSDLARRIYIDRLTSTAAELVLIPRKAGKQPRVFQIHDLLLTEVGFERSMPFEATLTNPLPQGLIKTKGHFGPWGREEPGDTPVSGTYTFENVDLGTIKGIGGRLDSTGQFKGQLDRIEVQGETRTPDFQLDVGGEGLPLTTKYRAVVDGTDGDTYLESVDATLNESVIFAKGAIVGIEGRKGRDIQLEARVDDGRIEDFLRLSVRAKRPILLGAVKLTTKVLLPPGEGKVIDRLNLDGRFSIVGGRFTDPDVQDKLGSLSKRASGEPDEEPENVVSNMSGQFTLESARLRLSALTFSLPGASVSLAGSYDLRSEALAFDGTFRMKATISEAAGGGVKGFFLKIVDPLFRKKGAGAVVPIKVRGTREQPKFGLDVGAVFKK